MPSMLTTYLLCYTLNPIFEPLKIDCYRIKDQAPSGHSQRMQWSLLPRMNERAAQVTATQAPPLPSTRGAGASALLSCLMIRAEFSFQLHLLLFQVPEAFNKGVRRAHPHFHTPESKESLGFSPPWLLPTCEKLRAKESPGQVPPAVRKHLREQAARRQAL